LVGEGIALRPSDAQATCGGKMKLGRRRVEQGDARSRGGSTVSTSKPATGNQTLVECPYQTRLRPPSRRRAVLMSKALRFILRNAAMSMRFRVGGHERAMQRKSRRIRPATRFVRA